MDEKLFGADLQATGIRVERERGDNAGRRISLTHLELGDIAGEAGGLAYQARSLSIDGASTPLGLGQVRAQAADLAELALRGAHMDLTARRVSCPSGMVYTAGREVYAPHVSFEDVRIAVDLAGLLARPRDPERAREPLDLRALDALAGRLDVDLAVDMTLPWVGRRRVTHYFRIPIDNGTIDYEKLEDDVHWLEAAFVTLDVVDDRLVLARDLPLLPYAGKALLWWPLEPEDVPLAAYRRVHVRNLLRWRLPEPKKAADRPDKSDKGDKSKSKSRLALHALAMENIKLSLDARAPARIDLPNGACLQFGDEDNPGLANLVLTGVLGYRADADADEPMTALAGTADLFDVTLSDVSLGRASLSVDRLHIAGVERFECSFQGFRPRRLELAIGRMAATNVRVRLPEPPG